MSEVLKISPRTLGKIRLAEFCQRCFWIELHCGDKLPYKIQFPWIFSSIDAYGKAIIHDYFDHKRKLPEWYPEIGPVKSYLSSQKLHWSRFRYEDAETRIVLQGTPDDIFRLEDETHHIVDYKTAKATKTQDGLFPMYEVQLNSYAFIGNRKGEFPTSELSLIYVEPMTDIPRAGFEMLMDDSGFALNFVATLRKVAVQPEELIPGLLRKAREIFDRSKAPDGREGCKDCEKLERVWELVKR